jgi:hypothetical protein
MAGREAEEEILGSCSGGDDDDRYQVNLMLDSVLPQDADVPAVARRLRASTRHLVRRHRQAIERVAVLLIKHGTLDAEAIDAAIDG